MNSAILTICGGFMRRRNERGLFSQRTVSFMRALHTTVAQVIAMLLLLLSVRQGLAAEPKAWEKLTDC